MQQDPQKENRIYLTKEEADAFTLIQKNIDKFIVMTKAGVFDLKFGNAVINYYDGEIRDIHINEVTYRKKIKNDDII